MLSVMFLMSVLSFADPSPVLFHTHNGDNNFEIMCNNESQLKYLVQNVSVMKKSIFDRWGLDNIDFRKKCVIVCIDDKSLYNKLFNRESYEYYENLKVNDQVVSVIWTYMNGNDWKNSFLSTAFTKACLTEYASVKGVTFPDWLFTGIVELNASKEYIHGKLLEANKMFGEDEKFYTFEELLTAETNSAEKSKWLEHQSLLMCLFLKKEFPKVDPMCFVGKAYSLEVLKENYGFDSFEEANTNFEKYMRNLCHDVSIDKTPASYYTNLAIPSRK